MRRQVLVLIGLAALGAASACKERGGDKPSAPRETITKDMPAHRVEWTPAPCRAGTTCTVALHLTTLGQYKVNKDYPFKFVPSETAGITVDRGEFVLDDEHAGTMTVHYRAAAPGHARVSGTFKLSVCSDDECRIEDEPVSVEIAVGT